VNELRSVGVRAARRLIERRVQMGGEGGRNPSFLAMNRGGLSSPEGRDRQAIEVPEANTVRPGEVKAEAID